MQRAAVALVVLCALVGVVAHTDADDGRDSARRRQQMSAVCDAVAPVRDGRVVSEEVDIPGLLQGTTLHVGLTLEPPYIVYERAGGQVVGYSGYIIDILEEVKRRGGFEIVLHALDESKIADGTESYTDLLVRELASGQWNVLASQWLETAQRRSLGALFGRRINDASGYVVAPRVNAQVGPSTKEKLKLFFKPFSGEVWATICCFLIVQAVVMFLMDPQRVRLAAELDDSDRRAIMDGRADDDADDFDGDGEDAPEGPFDSVADLPRTRAGGAERPRPAAAASLRGNHILERQGTARIAGLAAHNSRRRILAANAHAGSKVACAEDLEAEKPRASTAAVPVGRPHRLRREARMRGLAVLHSVYEQLSHFTMSADASITPVSWIARGQNLLWSFIVMLTISAYTANLATFLIVRSQPAQGITGVSDLLARRIPTCVPLNSALGGYIQERYRSLNVVRTTYLAGIDDIVAGKCRAIILPLFDAQGYLAKPPGCDFELRGQPLVDLGGAFTYSTDPASCGPGVMVVVDALITELSEEGYLEELWATYVQSECANGEDGADEESLTLSMENFFGPFLIYGCGTALFLAATAITRMLSVRSGA